MYKNDWVISLDIPITEAHDEFTWVKQKHIFTLVWKGVVDWWNFRLL